jgi:hypothetical protein
MLAYQLTFQPHTHTRTCLVIVVIVKEERTWLSRLGAVVSRCARACLCPAPRPAHRSETGMGHAMSCPLPQRETDLETVLVAGTGGVAWHRRESGRG